MSGSHVANTSSRQKTKSKSAWKVWVLVLVLLIAVAALCFLLWARLFGAGRGAGAALMMFLLGVLGVAVCLGFGRALKKYEYKEQ